VADVSHRLAQALVRAERQHSRLLALLRSLASLRPSLTVDALTSAPTVSFAPGPGGQPETLDGLFDLLGSGGHTVAVLDEFQDIQDLPAEDAIMARLCSLVQLQEQAAFVFCGSTRSRMEETFTSSDSPFFSAAMRLFVGPLERPPFHAFLRREFQTGRRRLAPGLLDAVLDACHDNPGDVQRFCTALWQVTAYGQEITREDLAEAWTWLFAMQADKYEVIMHALSPQQAQVLAALARAGGRSNLSRKFVEDTAVSLLPSVSKALAGLVAKRIVQKEGTTYRICDPFLAAWLQRQPA
jgi:hypothetical protein